MSVNQAEWCQSVRLSGVCQAEWCQAEWCQSVRLSGVSQAEVSGFLLHTVRLSGRKTHFSVGRICVFAPL